MGIGEILSNVWSGIQPATQFVENLFGTIDSLADLGTAIVRFATTIFNFISTWFDYFKQHRVEAVVAMVCICWLITCLRNFSKTLGRKQVFKAMVILGLAYFFINCGVGYIHDVADTNAAATYALADAVEHLADAISGSSDSDYTIIVDGNELENSIETEESSEEETDNSEELLNDLSAEENSMYEALWIELYDSYEEYTTAQKQSDALLDYLDQSVYRKKKLYEKVYQSNCQYELLYQMWEEEKIRTQDWYNAYSIHLRWSDTSGDDQ